MHILERIFGHPEPTDFELTDGSGVARDPDTGEVWAGTVEPDGPRGTDWVCPPRGADPPDPPEGWQDQVVRQWRS